MDAGMPGRVDTTRRVAVFVEKTKRILRQLRSAFAENLRVARTDSSSRPFHAEAVAYIYTFNVILMTILGSSYLATVPEGTSLAG